MNHLEEAQTWMAEAESAAGSPNDLKASEMALMAIARAQIDAASSLMSISNLLLGILEEMQRRTHTQEGGLT